MTLNLQYGKQQRLERLKNAQNAYCLLALDHQLSVGRISEIDSYNEWIKFANEADISGIVLNKGAFRTISPSNKKPIILQTMGAPSQNNTIEKILIGSIEDAIRFDATCIAIQLNFEDQNYLRQLEIGISQIERAGEFNIPVLCMLNMPQNKKLDTSLFIRYVKQCSEIGVDLIKTTFPTDLDINNNELRQFIQHSPPLLVAGGDKNENFFDELKNARNLGFSGICVGRNIFKSKDPGDVIKTTNQIFSNE